MKDLDFLVNKKIAHRGLHGKGVPENSLLAFKCAIKENMPIELDLHLTKNNEVVVIHDDNIKRMTGIDKKVKNLKMSDLKKIYLLNSKEHIPLFKDVLSLVDGKVPLIIELKYDRRVGLLEDKVAKLLKNYKGLYAIKSFRSKTIFYLKRTYPYIIRGQLINNKKNIFYSLFFYLRLCLGIITKPDFLSCDKTVLKEKVIKNLRCKKVILGYVIKNRNELKLYQDYCDSVIIER